MSAIPLTYQWLGTTRNASVIELLAIGLGDSSPAVRRLALSTLVNRNDDRSGDLILQHWDRLSGEDRQQLLGQGSRMTEPVRRCLIGNRHLMAAIDACAFLNLSVLIGPLVTIAETSPDASLRRFASRAAIEMAIPLGRNARRDRGLETLRSPVLLRLAESVQRFSSHQNRELIEAFLVVCTWSDSRLRSWLQESCETSQRLQTVLERSRHPAVLSLLAGYLKRRNLPPCIAEILRRRSDSEMGIEILKTVGGQPGSTVAKNLRTVGIPASLRGGIKRLTTTPIDRIGAVIAVYAAAGTATPQVLQIMLAGLSIADQPADGENNDQNNPMAPGDLDRGKFVAEIYSAAAAAMSQRPIPDEQRLLRAAASVARIYERRSDSNPADLKPADLSTLSGDSRWVGALIELIEHPDAGVAAGARRMLTPLQADNMLVRFDELRRRSRRRLGHIVKRVDPAAVDRVRDALRHPVLQRRIEAIATADALAIIELLSDSFTHITRNDHQEARIRAAVAMGDATDETSLELLREMIRLPESQVRDAAEAALRRRDQASAAQLVAVQP